MKVDPDTKFRAVQYRGDGSLVDPEVQVRIPYKGYLIHFSTRPNDNSIFTGVLESENVIRNFGRFDATAAGIVEAMAHIDDEIYRKR